MLFRPFETAMEFVAKWEGGYSNDPADPGGATNFGVTQRTYDAWRRKKGLPLRSVKEIEYDEVLAIYREDYWNPLFKDNAELPWDLAIVAFDAAVNCGTSRALRWIKKSEDAPDGVKVFNQYRRMHYGEIVQKNPPLQKFLKGWHNRVNDLDKLIAIKRQEVSDGTLTVIPPGAPSPCRPEHD